MINALKLDNVTISPAMFNTIDKRTQKKLKRHLDDDSRILDENSRSCQTWKNVPRFNMDMVMGNCMDKKAKQEKIAKALLKKKQHDVKSFFVQDPYLTKTM